MFTLVVVLTVATVLGGNKSKQCEQGMCTHDCPCNNAGGGRRLQGEGEPKRNPNWQRDTPIKLDNGDIFNADYACMFAMDAARDENKNLRRIMAKDRSGGSDMLADAVTEHLQVVQRKCFVEAKKAIAQLGDIRRQYPDVVLNKMPDKKKEQVENRAHAAYKLILDMKQCIAYTELAGRHTRNNIVWAWVMSSGTRAEQDMACGALVNTVNAGLKADAVTNANLMQIEDYDDVIHVKALKMSDRLQRAEKQAGISKLMAEVLGLTSVLAGSMMAQICNLWAGQDTF